MMKRLRQVLEMIRFSHTIFALPFAMLAATMAWTTKDLDALRTPFRLQDLVGILFCMVTARSAAMAFNRLVDHSIDAENPRTESRHLPQELVSRRFVGGFVLLTAVLFVAATLLFLPNYLPLYLSVPVLLFLLLYSYTKRFTTLAHFYLGAALMLAPLSVWIALRGPTVMENPADLIPAALLGFAVLLWVGGFDIIYACQDAEFDMQVRLHSIPARWGITRSLRIAAVSHLGMLLVLLVLPWSASLGGPPLTLGWIYYVGILAVAVLLAYEHWIVRPDDLSRVNLAFFRVNAVVSIGLFLIVTLDLLLN
ncbi:MAG: UbiA-like polyprenyltransferase [Pirellulaceae bacterium]